MPLLPGQQLEGAELSLVPTLKATASCHLVVWPAPGWARMEWLLPHYTDEEVEATGRLTPATTALPWAPIPQLPVHALVPWREETRPGFKRSFLGINPFPRKAGKAFG